MTHGYATYANKGCRCDVCRSANAAYMREYRQRTGNAYQAAYQRALKRLLATHPAEFRQLLAEERKNAS